MEGETLFIKLDVSQKLPLSMIGKVENDVIFMIKSVQQSDTNSIQGIHITEVLALNDERR